MQDDQPEQRTRRRDRPYYEPPTVPVLPEDITHLPADPPPVPPAPPPRPPLLGRFLPRRSAGGKRTGCLRTGLLISLYVLIALAGTGTLAGFVVYNSLAGELESDLAVLESMEGVENFQTSRIYDRDGVLLYELIEEGRRTEVPLDQIPIAMRWAIVATEDDTFYDNPGFDPPSIARAAWEWLSTGDIVSGGSTITQQLIRQIVFSYEERIEQTLRRKIKEIVLAWVMTGEYSKDEILSLYLNEIYFGSLAYGVEAASQTYFGKPATDLTIAEAAFLAGLVQSPATYDPYTNFPAARERQRQVLNLMVRHGYLSQSDADAAYAEGPLTVDDLESPAVSLLAPHFTVEVRQQLAELPGLDALTIARGGLTITTTLDMDWQRLAEQVVAQRVAEIALEANLNNAALVAINPNTGEVLAMVGSVDYDNEAIDGSVNVILSQQQPGSAMKPLTYATAFERGWLPSDILWDVPMEYDTGTGGDPYRPGNYDGRFHGAVRLRDALANSYNIPAVTLLREVSVPGLLEMAHRLGVESLGEDASHYGLSLTLGGGELTPLELTAAYGAFASGGRRVTPIFISRVTDSQGNVLYEAPPIGGGQILDPRVAYLISDILSDNVARTPAMGADSALLLQGIPAAVKTGTTNDYRDNWTIGYTPHLVVGVWAGNTDNTPMAEGTSGLTGAAPIWHDFMTAIYNDPSLTAVLEGPGLPPLRADFAPPEGLEERPVCVLSSLRDPALAQEGCPRSRTEWFPSSGSLALVIPPTAVPTPTTPPATDPATGQVYPALRGDFERGIDVIGVIRLTDEQRGAYFPPQPASGGGPAPAQPIYCELAPQYADLTSLTMQLFISAPTNPDDAVRARNWAIINNWPIDPGALCPVEMAERLRQEQGGPPTGDASYQITAPRRDEAVWGVLPIVGTANFDPAFILFYKVEIGFGPSPTEWATLGDIHTTPVINGTLEVLHADALPPGAYVLRLLLIQALDANPLVPFEVPIVILSGPPTPTAPAP